MTSPTRGLVWSDGLYLNGDIPTSNLTAYDNLSWKTEAINSTQMLVYAYCQGGYTNGADVNSDKRTARVVTAGNPPTGGPILDVLVDRDWANQNFDPSVNWGSGIDYCFDMAFGLRKVSSTRPVFLTVDTAEHGAPSGPDSGKTASSLVVTALTVAGEVVTVADRWSDTQLGIGPNTGIVYYDFCDVVKIGEGVAAIFYAHRPGGWPNNPEAYYRIVTVDAANRITVGPEVHIPNLGCPDGGAWSNGSTVGVLNTIRTSQIWPFRIVGNDIVITQTTIQGARHPENGGIDMNEGIIGNGPKPNQFVASVYDEPRYDNDYLALALFETDGSTVTIVDESLGYSDDAGEGYPDAWLPGTTDRFGKTAFVYGAGQWDTDHVPDPAVSLNYGGAHGHHHGGIPVLVYDVYGKATWDDVTEVEMPQDGMYAIYYPKFGPAGPSDGCMTWSSRSIQAVDAGLFVLVASDAQAQPYNIPCIIGFVPLGNAAIDGGLMDSRRRFYGGGSTL